MKDSSDYKFIKMLLRYGSFICVTPFGTNNSKIYQAILASFFLTATGICIPLNILEYWKINEAYVVNKFIFSLWCFFQYIFLAVIHLKFFTSKKISRTLFKIIENTEYLLYSCNFRDQNRYFEYHLEILLLGAFLLSLELASLIHSSYRIQVIYFSWRIIKIHLVFTFILILNLCRFLRKRYSFLEHFIVSTKIDSFRDLTVHRLRKAIEFSRNLSAVTLRVSELFEWHLFLVVVLIVLYILLSFVHFLNGLGEVRKNVIDTCTQVISFGFYIVFLMVMVMSCDSVERIGKQVIKTCYLLHERVGDDAVKDQILLLAQYAEQWRPVFSAAGFYDINRTCLSAIFSAIITHLVIIIQFNMMLVEDAPKATQGIEEASNLTHSWIYNF